MIEALKEGIRLSLLQAFLDWWIAMDDLLIQLQYGTDTQ